MAKTPYVVQAAPDAFCPNCRATRPVRLLVREDGRIDRGAPAFYLCGCGFVGHVGVGPVPEEKTA